MRYILFTSAFVFVLVVQIGWGEIPEQISFQGVLTDAGGNPMNGQKLAIFHLYEATDVGVKPVWKSNVQTVEVKNGVFNVTLDLNDNNLHPPNELTFDNQYLLGVTLEGDQELPRIPLTSSLYSLNARNAQNLKLPFLGVYNGVGGNIGFSISHIGAEGPAAIFGISDTKNSAPALVSNTSGTGPALQATGTLAGDFRGHVNIQDGRDAAVIYFPQTGTYPNLYIRSDDDPSTYEAESERFFVGGNGKVGIGRTNPETKLHVDGGQLTIEPSKILDSNPGVLTLRPSANGEWWNLGNTVNGGKFMIRTGDLRFANDLSDWELPDGNPVQLTIQPNGYLGIGTPNPSDKIHIHDDNLPSLKLSGATHSAQLSLATQAGNYSEFSDVGDVVLRGDNNLLFGSGKLNKEFMRITSDGKVGIGTDKPSAGLEVAGDVWVNGKVGIGTTGDPTAKLEVAGEVSVESVFLGDPADQNTPGFHADDKGTAELVYESLLQISRRRGNPYVFIGANYFSIGTPVRPDPNTGVTIGPSGDGSLLNFGTEKPWKFKSASAHDYSILDLQSLSDVDSSFSIASKSGRTPLYVQIDSVNPFHDFVSLVPDGGKVGIGTVSPKSELDVRGTIIADEIIVKENKGADFVFEDGYSLMPLRQLEQSIKQNKHLPEIPSASEMRANGVNMAGFQIQLLQKIEELTLYVIELKNENEQLKYRVDMLEK